MRIISTKKTELKLEKSKAKCFKKTIEKNYEYINIKLQSIKSMCLILLIMLISVPIFAQNYFVSDADISEFLKNGASNQIDWIGSLPIEKINNSKIVKEAYNEAKNKEYGYRLLQLAALESSNSFTYGELSSSIISTEAYNIALLKKDAYLVFFVTEFNLECDYSSSLALIKEMFIVSHKLALEQKKIDILYLLADLKDRLSFNVDIPSKDIRKQALFINNKDFVPYPNPYDNPEINKILDRSPFIWKDYPSDIDTEYEMNQAYMDALKSNDGYRLLQLAKIELISDCSKEVTPEVLLINAYNIASYNKDPYLLLYVSSFVKNGNLLQDIDPSEVFRQAYYTAIERRDSDPLYLFYIYEKRNDFLSDLTPGKIMNKAKEIEKLYREPLK